MMERPLTQHIRPGESRSILDGYETAGGYQALRKALREHDAPGGDQQRSRIPTCAAAAERASPPAMKWGFVPHGRRRTRTRSTWSSTPTRWSRAPSRTACCWRAIRTSSSRGDLSAAYAIQADVAYIFLRWAYKRRRERLQPAIAEAYEAGYLGENILGSGLQPGAAPPHQRRALHLRRGDGPAQRPGGQARHSPRQAALSAGGRACGASPPSSTTSRRSATCPTSSTTAPTGSSGSSRTDDGGTKIYGVSGRVRTPGAWELPMGTTIREILEEHAGGMRDGYQLSRAAARRRLHRLSGGGASGVRWISTSVQEAGSRLGTGTMIVLDDRTCPVGMVHNLERFFAQESCGWCTPCRDGSALGGAACCEAMEEGRGRPGRSGAAAHAHCTLLGPGHTFCALAPGAMEPLQSALKYFRGRFRAAHSRARRCPWR